MADNTKLELLFHEAMLGIYVKAGKECKYYARRFLQMVRNRGGLQAAKKLLRNPGLSPGLIRLKECKRLDLSMEALILQPEWQELFSDEERAIAKKRLDIVKEYPTL